MAIGGVLYRSAANIISQLAALTSGKTIVGAGASGLAESTLTATVVNSSTGTLGTATAGTDYTNLAFKTIAVSGQSDIVADTPADTLTIAAGSNITLTTNAGTDTLTIAASGGGGGTPGGSDTQVQYNNAGAFGGITGATTNGTAMTMVAPVLGTPASGTLTNCTGYPAASLATISSIYITLQDQQAQNTQGGTFSSGAWRTRVLNTEVSDVGNLCALASNQFTLTAGTYIIHASAPAYFVNRHQLRLQNVTDTATLLVGPGNYAFRDSSGDGSETPASLVGIFTIAASKALELQHQCGTTNNTNGFGVANNFTTEVYAVVELWKVG